MKLIEARRVNLKNKQLIGYDKVNQSSTIGSNYLDDLNYKATGHERAMQPQLGNFKLHLELLN